MISFVRKALEIYLREHRIITSTEFTAEDIVYTTSKNSVFVTLYFNGKVIASQGRIACKKENTLAECLDLTLACLKDPRFSENLQNIDLLSRIAIRVDTFDASSRRQIKSVSELQADEGLIFLSPSLGKMSVILPYMIDNPSSEKFLDFAKQKAGITEDIAATDYFLYALKTSIMKE